MMREDPGESIVISLTMEDDFTLTRLKNKASVLRGDAQNKYLWKTILRFVCRERAYKTVIDDLGLNVDTNVDIFAEEDDWTYQP